MKRLTIWLSILIFAGGFISAIYAGNPQDIKAKKQAYKAKLEEAYEETNHLLKDKSFVLEADYLENIYGIEYPVMSDLNFIKVQDSTAVLQVGSNNGIGLNGVGGITVEGQITSWNLKKNSDNKSFFLKVSILSSTGSYDIFFIIGANGHAHATVSGITPGKLTYDGDLVPITMSDTFQGSTSY